MIKVQECKCHGACNNCGKTQKEVAAIYEIRISKTEQGWNVIMLCEECFDLLKIKIEEVMEKFMYGITGGVTDGDEINYCPYCREKITVSFSDGTVACDECFRRFGVVEAENED